MDGACLDNHEALSIGVLIREQATTHSSFEEKHNQRLELLGNGALNLDLADLLHRRYKD